MVQIIFLDRTLANLDEGEYWDQKLPSFGIRVGKRTRTFILKKGNRRIKIGRYPALSLSHARRRVFELKADPETMAADISFKEARTLFFETHCQQYRPKVLYETVRYLAKYPDTKLSKISTQHVYQIIDAQTRAEANKLFTVSRTFFRFCVRRRLIPKSPLDGLQIPNKETSRARVLSDHELKCIWQACEQSGRELQRLPTATDVLPVAPLSLPASFCKIVKLLILSGQRRGEIAALQTSWIKENTITLPPSVTKNGREHTIPIGSLTQTLLNSSMQDGLLFPARGSTFKPFNGWSKSKAALDKLCGVKNWTLHDLRRTYATKMADLGVAPHIIERLLNHISGQISGVSAIYNRAKYTEEMREAVQLYEKHLRSVVG